MAADDESNKPTPDPTSLTTDALEREIKHLRELIEARLDQMDKAVEAARATSAEAVIELDSNITRRLDSLSVLTDSKFITHRTLLDSQADKVALALSASNMAVSKAETAVDKRLEQMNEFRAALTDQAASFVPRTEFIAALHAVTEKIDDLKAYRDTSQGRFAAVPNTDARLAKLAEEVASLRDSRSTLAGQASGDNVMATLAAIQKQINDNSSAIITNTGRSEGVRLTAGVLAASLTAVVAVITIVVFAANVLTGPG